MSIRRTNIDVKLYRFAIGNTSTPALDHPGFFDFTLFVQLVDKALLADFRRDVYYVRFDLHPSFSPSYKIKRYPWTLTSRGWLGRGEFDVRVSIVWHKKTLGARHCLTQYTHKLCYQGKGNMRLMSASSIEPEPHLEPPLL